MSSHFKFKQFYKRELLGVERWLCARKQDGLGIHWSSVEHENSGIFEKSKTVCTLTRVEVHKLNSLRKST